MLTATPTFGNGGRDGMTSRTRINRIQQRTTPVPNNSNNNNSGRLALRSTTTTAGVPVSSAAVAAYCGKMKRSSDSPRRRNSPSFKEKEGDFVFWRPEERDSKKPTSPSKIPVLSGRGSAIIFPPPPPPLPQGRPPRPIFPSMTSTPRSEPKQRIQETKKENTGEDEPIYCEISETGTKQRRHDFQKSLNKMSSPNRQSGTDYTTDFSRMINDNDDSLPARIRRPGLGRRAATQFDLKPEIVTTTNTTMMATTAALSSSPCRRPAPFYDPPLPAVPFSQPPQRKFIKVGNSGYASDNDFASLVNESLASTSIPGSGGDDVSEVNVNPGSTLKKGLLWQQRDKLFSRWKERFFILTKDYLQCFRRGSSRISEMGAFIFRIRLNEVDDVELIDKRGYLTITLSLGRDGKVLLRKPDGIREWFTILKECIHASKERKGMMKSTKEFWSKKQFTDSSSMEQYILARQRIGRQYSYCTENESDVPLKFRQSQLKHYGYIDSPRYAIEEDEKFHLQSLCSDFYLKSNVRDFSSEFSHDSGVDSMNTNSSGSVMSGSIISPVMNRPLNIGYSEEDHITILRGKAFGDRKISLV